jgi:hypothetical protein
MFLVPTGDRRPAVADSQGEGVTGPELLDLSNQILKLTKAIHAVTGARSAMA